MACRARGDLRIAAGHNDPGFRVARYGLPDGCLLVIGLVSHGAV